MDNIPDTAFLLDSLLQARANLTEEGGSFPVPSLVGCQTGLPIWRGEGSLIFTLNFFKHRENERKRQPCDYSNGSSHCSGNMFSNFKCVLWQGKKPIFTFFDCLLYYMISDA